MTALDRLREAVAHRAGVPADQVDLAHCHDLLPHPAEPCSAHCHHGAPPEPSGGPR